MAADNIMEAYIFDAYFNEEPISAIRHGIREQYGEDILFNRYEAQHFRNTTIVAPPEWATYMYVFLVGAGGGGGSGNGGNTRGGAGGSPGSTHVAGYYLDGALAGWNAVVTVGAAGAGGDHGNAGQSGGTTTFEIGGFSSTAAGGSGGAGGTLSSPTNGQTWRHNTDPPQRARLNNSSTTITRGVAGYSGSGGAGTMGNGGGGGSGGIFGVFNSGGSGGPGYVDIHFWGVDPYD